jgi:hypothetical protein
VWSFTSASWTTVFSRLNALYTSEAKKSFISMLIWRCVFTVSTNSMEPVRPWVDRAYHIVISEPWNGLMGVLIRPKPAFLFSKNSLQMNTYFMCKPRVRQNFLILCQYSRPCKFKAALFRSSLFCDVTQRWFVFGYRRFGTAYQPHLQWLQQSKKSFSCFFDWFTLDDGTDRVVPLISYQPILPNIR